jgi:hypothetical protein
MSLLTLDLAYTAACEAMLRLRLLAVAETEATEHTHAVDALRAEAERLAAGSDTAAFAAWAHEVVRSMPLAGDDHVPIPGGPPLAVWRRLASTVQR